MKRSQFLRAAPFLAFGAVLLIPTSGEAKKKKRKKGKNKNNRKKKRSTIRLKSPTEPSSIRKAHADVVKERRGSPLDYYLRSTRRDW